MTREITSAWLARDRQRIAVQLNDSVIWVQHFGAELDVEYEVAELPDDEWDELYPETDFG